MAEVAVVVTEEVATAVVIQASLSTMEEHDLLGRLVRVRERHSTGVVGLLTRTDPPDVIRPSECNRIGEEPRCLLSFSNDVLVFVSFFFNQLIGFKFTNSFNFLFSGGRSWDYGER